MLGERAGDLDLTSNADVRLAAPRPEEDIQRGPVVQLPVEYAPRELVLDIEDRVERRREHDARRARIVADMPLVFIDRALLNRPQYFM